MTTSFNFATCLPAMIAISQAVLSSRVAAGTRWLRLGLDSASPIDLEHVANLAPIPTLSTISATWMSRAWTAALAGKHSVFDTLTPSSNSMESSSSTTSSPATNVKSLPLDKLVSKLISYINVSPSVLITALILLDRLTSVVPEVLLNDGNVHKLYVVAFMIAAKLLEDDYNPASWFASFLGCSEEHIKYLELLFLKGIDYHVFVTSSHFDYALHCFTTEAIDSPMALQVIASFPNCQLASRAVDLASSWNVYPLSNTKSCKNTISSSYRAEPPPSELCLRALADAQLSHDCPGFGTDNSWTDFASRIYSPIGFIRLMSLKRLIDGVVASSLLPALELNPHTNDDQTKIDGDIDDPNAKGRVILEGLGWGKLYKRGWQDENSKLVDADLSVAPVYTAGSIWAL